MASTMASKMGSDIAAKMAPNPHTLARARLVAIARPNGMTTSSDANTMSRVQSKMVATTREAKTRV